MIHNKLNILLYCCFEQWNVGTLGQISNNEENTYGR